MTRALSLMSLGMDRLKVSALKPRDYSPAERVIVECLVHGLSNKEIAQSLGKAPGTVKCQIGSIFRKAGVESRAQFIAMYYRDGAAQAGMSAGRF
jgi:DNA-binding NarL/FixJ family response regulator